MQKVDPVKSERARRTKTQFHHPNSLMARAINNKKFMAKLKAGRERMNGDSSAKLSQMVRGVGGPHMQW